MRHRVLSSVRLSTRHRHQVVCKPNEQETTVLMVHMFFCCKVVLGKVLGEACVGLEEQSRPAHIVHMESYGGDQDQLAEQHEHSFKLHP